MLRVIATHKFEMYPGLKSNSVDPTKPLSFDEQVLSIKSKQMCITSPREPTSINDALILCETTNQSFAILQQFLIQ